MLKQRKELSEKRKKELRKKNTISTHQNPKPIEDRVGKKSIENKYYIIVDEQGWHVRSIYNSFHIFTAYHNYDADPTSAKIQAQEVCDALNDAFFKGYQYSKLQDLTKEN